MSEQRLVNSRERGTKISSLLALGLVGLTLASACKLENYDYEPGRPAKGTELPSRTVATPALEALVTEKRFALQLRRGALIPFNALNRTEVLNLYENPLGLKASLGEDLAVFRSFVKHKGEYQLKSVIRELVMLTPDKVEDEKKLIDRLLVPTEDRPGDWLAVYIQNSRGSKNIGRYVVASFQELSALSVFHPGQLAERDADKKLLVVRFRVDESDIFDLGQSNVYRVWDNDHSVVVERKMEGKKTRDIYELKAPSEG